MNTARFPVLLLLLGGFASAAPALPAGQAPSIIEPKVERTEGPPLWLSAEAAIDPQTVLDWDELGREDYNPLRREVLKQQSLLEKSGALKPGDAFDPTVRPIPTAECRAELGASEHLGGDSPKRNLADLVRYSRAIFRGSVESVDFGFDFGVPSSLLTVKIVEVLQPTPELQGGRVYIPHPVARFAIGPYRFCNFEKGFAPAVGDQILVFDAVGPADRQGTYFAPAKEQVFYQTGAGGLVLPDRLKTDPALAAAVDLDDVVAMVREQMRHPLRTIR